MTKCTPHHTNKRQRMFTSDAGLLVDRSRKFASKIGLRGARNKGLLSEEFGQVGRQKTFSALLMRATPCAFSFIKIFNILSKKIIH